MKNGFIIGTSAVLATAGLLAGGVALNNKFAKDKITIKHGESVLVGDKDKAPVDAFNPEESLTPEEKLMCQEFAERTNMMVVSIVNYGSEYLTIQTYSADFGIYDVVQDMAEYCRGSLYRTNLADQFDKAFISFNGELISVQEMEDILPEKMVEFKAGYYEFNVVGEYYGRVLFNDLDGSYSAETEDGYFHTDNNGIIQTPPTADEIDGYTFVGWSIEKDNIDKIIDLATHRFSFANVTSVYPIYVNAEGEVLPSAVVVNLHIPGNDIKIHGELGQSELVLNHDTILNLGVIEYGIEFVGFVTEQWDTSNPQSTISITEDCDIFLVYKNSSTQEVMPSYQTNGVKIVCGNTTKTIVYVFDEYSNVISYFNNISVSQFIENAPSGTRVVSINNLSSGETIKPRQFTLDNLCSGCTYEIIVGTQEDYTNQWG